MEGERGRKRDKVKVEERGGREEERWKVGTSKFTFPWLLLFYL